MGVRVLLIEDDETIAEPLAEGLGHFGLTVDRVSTGAAGLRGPYGDVVLLDLGLPDMDGIDVCRGIRQASDVPIIILSARGEEADRVLGLELGADDYLAKPFSLRELVARVRAITRRAQYGRGLQQGLGDGEFGGTPAAGTPVVDPRDPLAGGTLGSGTLGAGVRLTGALGTGPGPAGMLGAALSGAAPDPAGAFGAGAYDSRASDAGPLPHSDSLERGDPHGARPRDVNSWDEEPFRGESFGGEPFAGESFAVGPDVASPAPSSYDPSGVTRAPSSYDPSGTARASDPYAPSGTTHAPFSHEPADVTRHFEPAPSSVEPVPPLDPESDRTSETSPPPAPGPLVVDRRTRQVWVGDSSVSLTPKEFELLALLTEDPGAVYSRQQILDRVWDPHYQGPTKTLDVHVATLRRKLGHPAWIQTLRGVGFRLAVQNRPPSAGGPTGGPTGGSYGEQPGRPSGASGASGSYGSYEDLPGGGSYEAPERPAAFR